jgi:hypothetical protein
MRFVRRVRQTCQAFKDDGAAASDGLPSGLRLPDPDEEANAALLSGTIVDEPVRDRSRDGDPVTVVLVSFDAPDE